MRAGFPHTLRARLLMPVDIAGAAFFRVAFGVTLFLYLVYMLAGGMIGPLFVDPPFHFTYPGFSWVKPWPLPLMYLHYALTALAALGIALGAYYYVSLAVFFSGWTYIFLLEEAYYLNHFYLVSLLAFLLFFVPAHRDFSWDARRKKAIRSSSIPAYTLWILRLQIGVVYFYAGISKIHPDWLAGQPMLGLVRNYLDAPLLGFLSQDAIALALSYGGLLLDLFIVPALLWRRTRLPAFLAAIVFHSTNSFLFTIDFFPVLALAGTLLFFPPDWPRRFLGLFRTGKSTAPDTVALDETPAPSRAVVLILAVYFFFQCALPLRHFFYPGDHIWTEQGHRFSWHLMLRNKNGRAAFIVEDPASGQRWKVDPENYLNARQADRLAIHPEMLVEFAHYLEGEFQSRGVQDPRVMAFARVSLNNRPPQTFIDPYLDLTTLQRPVWDLSWVLPLETAVPGVNSDQDP